MVFWIFFTGNQGDN